VLLQCLSSCRCSRIGARGGDARAQWVGYIKDYDGGTLMECVVHAALPYAALPAMVAAQRGALDARIRSLSNAHVVHPGLPAARRPLPVGEIPGAALGGWQSAACRVLCCARPRTQTGLAALGRLHSCACS
jgi:hypothetical protein